MAIGLDQGGKAPLADAAVGQHGRQDDDAQFGDAGVRGGRRFRLESGGGQQQR